MDQLITHLLEVHAIEGESMHHYVWAANIHGTRLARALATRCPTLKPVIVDSAASKIGIQHEGFEAPVEPPSENVSRTDTMYLSFARRAGTTISGNRFCNLVMQMPRSLTVSVG